MCIIKLLLEYDVIISKWTERGCKVSHSDHKRTVCQCNHLTNFAILMRPYSHVRQSFFNIWIFKKYLKRRWSYKFQIKKMEEIAIKDFLRL